MVKMKNTYVAMPPWKIRIPAMSGTVSMPATGGRLPRAAQSRYMPYSLENHQFKGLPTGSAVPSHL